MFTIFTSPKPFTDLFVSMIQRNAIQSWIALQPKCNIILFGNESGTAEVAAEYNLKHVPDVECKNGMPLVSALFRGAEVLSKSDLMVYVNADIILLSDFTVAVARVQKEMAGCPFLMVGQRCNLEIQKPLDFSSPFWEDNLHRQMGEQGEMAAPGSIDYFVFTRGLWPNIPSLTIGVVAFDNWLIYEARRLGANVIDATQVVKVVHQWHEFFASKTALNNFMWKRRKAPRALEQVRLAGAERCLFTIDNANWILKMEGLVRPKISIKFLYRAINVRCILSYNRSLKEILFPYFQRK